MSGGEVAPIFSSVQSTRCAVVFGNLNNCEIAESLLFVVFP